MAGQGVVGEVNPSSSLNFANTNREDATSGDVKNGPIFNISSVGSIGTVKLLALGGLTWLLLQFFKKK